MDANWRPTQGFDPAAVDASVDPNAAAPAGCEWHAQLQPEARSRIVNKIMETLKKHLPVSVPEGLNELQKIAVRFEEKIYTAATSQSDYLRKISLKMLSMEKDTAGSWECTSDSKSKQPRSSETTRCEFVERTEAALKEPIFTCPVCLNKLEQPSVTTCGHIFCEKCIKASIKAQKKCPTCRKNLGTRSYHRIYLPATADQGY